MIAGKFTAMKRIWKTEYCGGDLDEALNALEAGGWNIFAVNTVKIDLQHFGHKIIAWKYA
jgi:hypothetical protein